MQCFTGFPGFLGSALLSRLLRRTADRLVCLVQPHFREQAESRADGLTDDADVGRDRIRLVER